MNALRSGERSLFVTLSKTVVVVLFLVFALISVAQNSVLVASLAGIGVFVTAAIILPLDRIRSGLEWFASGEAGTWLHNTYLSLMPGRSPDDRRRGQITVTRLVALALVVALVASAATIGAGTVAGTTVTQDDTDTTSQCTDVVHDSYLTDESYVQEFENTSTIESTNRNVRTSLEETEAFVRLKAENPNSYCVNMTVKLHPDIIPPAEVGEITDTNNTVDSTWRNTHDFDTDQSYTKVTFRLEADSEVMFAPSRVRVLGIAWKDKQTDPSGILDRITSPLGGEDDLDERTYEINSSEGSMVTVPLEHNDGQSIDEWQAVYRVGDERWRPITTDSSDPAFYKEVDGGQALQFHFDTDSYDSGEIEVEFTANPNQWDKTKHDYRSYSASWSDVFDFDFDILAMTPPVAIAGMNGVMG